MRFIKGIILFASILTILVACTAEHSKIIVAEFEEDKILMEEFERAYMKNIGEDEIDTSDSTASMNEFLDLYVTYKMKLKDAELRGYHNDPQLEAELERYRRDIGIPYFINKYVTDPSLEDLYEKRKEEIRLSHIMFRTEGNNAQEKEALADSVLSMLKAGADYDSLAKLYSDDIHSKENGGDIYYITAGQVIPEFEKPAYTTQVGELYPQVVTTRYGYHILKVTDRLPRKNKVKASHILIRFKSDSLGVHKEEALAEIEEIRKQLVNGADFAELAKQHSADEGSGAKGGDLGFFGRRQMVRPFDEAVFSMNVGDISEVIETQFGYHIIKLTDVEKAPSYKDDKENLKKLHERSRKPYEKKKLIEELKERYDFVSNKKKLEEIIYTKPNPATYGEKYPGSELDSLLKNHFAYKLKGEEVSSDSLMAAISRKPNYNGSGINQRTFPKAFDMIVSDHLLYERVSELDTTDSEFVDLMEEYKNGIYIFKLQENEIWNSLTVDSTKLEAIWETTKEDYIWPDRVSFLEIFSIKKDSITVYYDSVKNGADFAELAAQKTERKNRHKTGLYELVEVESSEMAKRAYKMEYGQVSEPFSMGVGWAIIKLLSKEPSGRKTFEEAIPQVASIYQERESQRLDEEYKQRLKEKFSPVLYYENANKAFKPESE